MFQCPSLRVLPFQDIKADFGAMHLVQILVSLFLADSQRDPCAGEPHGH